MNGRQVRSKAIALESLKDHNPFDFIGRSKTCVAFIDQKLIFNTRKL